MLFKRCLISSLFLFIFLSCSESEQPPIEEAIQLETVNVGPYSLQLNEQEENTDVPVDRPIVCTFSSEINISTIFQAVSLKLKDGELVPLTFSLQDANKTIVANPSATLVANQLYQLIITDVLTGANGEVFDGLTIEFKTLRNSLLISSVTIDGQTATSSNVVKDVNRTPSIQVSFSQPVKTATVTNTSVQLTGTGTSALIFNLSADKKTLTVSTSESLNHLSKYTLLLSSYIEGETDEAFSGYSKTFYTEVDPTPKKPVISDEELLTLVQQQTFKYFYDFAEPNSGLARERNTSGDLVTSGGSGFGIMALIVGIERNFITRQQGIDRMDKIVSFLETADRFHGVWSHWINGNTGKVIPFSTKDNGGDLVETSFLVQGLLTFRQYLQPTDTVGNNLINRINTLWEGVEWDWYRKNGEEVLYWHWSPNYNWDMNFAMYGYFEQQITYFLAAASPTHSIPKSVYTNGFARNGNIVRNDTYYNIPLKLGGLFPLFWTHYSYVGLDPHFSDDYANYWDQNVSASRINQAYCIANPRNYVGYSESCWGLTSSDNQSGYNAHSPSNDLGVITPTAALSAFPYTPEESMKALKFFYYTMGDKLWGQYGFYDAFNITQGWVASSYLAIDQGPIIVMIENHRTGLLWDLFMSAPEVQAGMDKLGFVKTN